MNLLSTITGVASRVGFALGKKSPTIMLVAGLVGMGGTILLACKATLKCSETLDIAHEKFENIEEAWEKSEAGMLVEPYTEKDKAKDKLTAYAQTGMDFVKLYGPSVVLFLVSLGLIIGGHKVLLKRNMALVASYKALDKAFKAYRKRHIEDYGEESDFMYINNLRAVEVTEEVTNPDGTVETKTSTVLQKADPKGKGWYSFRFAKGEAKEWTPSRMYNETFLTCQQNNWNDILHCRRHVFVNEILDRLGIERTDEGSSDGWHLDKNPNAIIDFGFGGPQSFRYDEFGGIILNLNAEGPIYHYLKTNKKQEAITA